VKLDWTTFILEIVNFLILMWVLKRLLIGPLRRVMDERRQAMAQERARSEQLKAEAEQLRRDLENRLEQWETEKRQLREAFQKDLNEEKNRRFKEWELSRAQETSRQELEMQRLTGKLYPDLQKQAIRQALQFASKLLAAVASSELEERLVHLMLHDLEQKPPATLTNLKLTRANQIHVYSAFQLRTAIQEELARTMAAILGEPAQLNYQVKEELLAGLELVFDSVSLKANLRDELAFFEEA
jgi:F-type H+-transporting ATPase subunit b